MSSAVPFLNVVRVIKEWAFRASPYPLIISVEQHCSNAQCLLQIHEMQQTFQSLLYVLPWDADKKQPDVNKHKFPPLNQMLNKILIKAKLIKGLDDYNAVVALPSIKWNENDEFRHFVNFPRQVII